MSWREGNVTLDDGLDPAEEQCAGDEVQIYIDAKLAREPIVLKIYKGVIWQGSQLIKLQINILYHGKGANLFSL